MSENARRCKQEDGFRLAERLAEAENIDRICRFLTAHNPQAAGSSHAPTNITDSSQRRAVPSAGWLLKTKDLVDFGFRQIRETRETPDRDTY